MSRIISSYVERRLSIFNQLKAKRNLEKTQIPPYTLTVNGKDKIHSDKQASLFELLKSHGIIANNNLKTHMFLKVCLM